MSLLGDSNSGWLDNIDQTHEHDVEQSGRSQETNDLETKAFVVEVNVVNDYFGSTSTQERNELKSLQAVVQC